MTAEPFEKTAIFSIKSRLRRKDALLIFQEKSTGTDNFYGLTNIVTAVLTRGTGTVPYLFGNTVSGTGTFITKFYTSFWIKI
jgi:hypothetical protein